MAPNPTPGHAEADEFSLPLFALTVLTSLAALLAVLHTVAPAVWSMQFLAPAWKWAVAFAGMTMVNCFFEFFFHRYILHTPALPILQKLYRDHTFHHALTRIARKPTKGGRELMFIENKFPITEPEQHESSFFPWYSLAAFALVMTPLFALMTWLAPSFPWFVGGLAALASSLTLYEVFHAINHWPLEVWEPLIEHRTFGGFWRLAYALHLRHHAVIDCNESISGFFGLPVADLVFGTCIVPKTIYADGAEWQSDEFRSPRPVWLIRRLDAWAQRAVQERRARAQAVAQAPDTGGAVRAPAAEGRAYTDGERIATGLGHGLGMALSLAGLAILIVYSSLRGTAWHVISFTVFGVAFLALYMVPTLSSVWRGVRGRSLFRGLGQWKVFLAIAGTFTPFALTALRGPWGWTVFGLAWGVCGAGAVFRLVFGRRSRLTTTIAYLFLGWLAAVALSALATFIPPQGLWLLLAGGVCYATGLLLYRWRSLLYHRVVGHGFLMGGACCHFFVVLLFLLPRAA